MAVIKTPGNSGYKILSNPRSAPAGSRLIPASQIKSSNTVQRPATDEGRPISYSDKMKSAAKRLGDSGNIAGKYYTWQDDPNAKGSAAWMEAELKKNGIDLSKKSDTGDAVKDFFIEAGKGVIEIPIGLKRTLAAGSLGVVGLSRTPADKAANVLYEGSQKAVKTTIDSAKDNPGRMTGAVVGGILLTKGVGGALKAVPRTVPKVKVSKSTTNNVITKTGTATVNTKTVTVSTPKRTAAVTIQKSKTGQTTNTNRTALIKNNKTGAGKAIQQITSKNTTVQKGAATLNPTLKSRKITMKESSTLIKAVNKKGVEKRSAIGKKAETVISRGGTKDIKARERVRTTETKAGTEIKRGNDTRAKMTVKRTQTVNRRLTKDGKTQRKRTGTRQKKTQYAVNGKPYDPKAPKVKRQRRTKNKSPAGKPSGTAAAGTIYIKSQPKTGGTKTGGSSSSRSSNGMMYQTKPKTQQQTKQKQKTKPQKGTGTYQTANILQGQTVTKPKQKTAVTSVNGNKQSAAVTTKTKPQPQLVKKSAAVKTETTTKTATASRQTTEVKTKSKTATGTAAASVRATIPRRKVKTAQKTEQRPKLKKKAVPKTTQTTRNKKRIRIPDEYDTKKKKKIIIKKPKGYLRSEKRNNLSWITDNTRLMKEKKITK